MTVEEIEDLRKELGYSAVAAVDMSVDEVESLLKIAIARRNTDAKSAPAL
jgi:hypothetical protein